MTTLRELTRLALPMVVSQGAFAVMIFTDRWFMAKLSATHIAATLGGGVAAFFCMSFFLGMIAYANALVAQYYGAKEFHKCSKVVTQGVLVAFAAVPFMLLATWGMGGLFASLGHEPGQVVLEREYFYVLMGGSLFTLIKSCFSCYFSGLGRTKVVMVVDLLGVVLNIALTWVLVFGHLGFPALGIVGAGLGTVASTVFSIAMLLCFYLGREHRQTFQVADSLGYHSGIMRRYLRLGGPSAVESFLNTATFNIFLLLFQSYGVVQGAAMAIVFNWDMLSFIPMVGLNIGVMSLIGRFVGAGDVHRVNQVISSGFILALCYSGALAILFLVFRFELVSVFRTPDANADEILVLAGSMMVGLVSYMLADAVLLVCSGALRGAGDTRWIMLVSTSLHWLMLVAQYFTIVVWKLDPMVSWWVFVVMLWALAVTYLARLLGGRWRLPGRLDRVMQEL